MRPLENLGGLDLTAPMLSAALFVVLLAMVSRSYRRTTAQGRSTEAPKAHSTATAHALRKRMIATGILAFAAVMVLVAGCSGSSGGGTPPPGGKGAAWAETTATGSFTDSMGIDVPAFHGIEPHVSLDYASDVGNREVGTGWKLAVGSRIIRAAAMGDSHGTTGATFSCWTVWSLSPARRTV